MGFMDKMKGAAEKAQAAMPVGASAGQMEQANLAQKLTKSGIESPAKIDSMTGTGNTDATNSVEHDIGVTISPAAGDPYQATIRQYVHPSLTDKYVVGAAVKVRVDPDDPSRAMLWGI